MWRRGKAIWQSRVGGQVVWVERNSGQKLWMAIISQSDHISCGYFGAHQIILHILHISHISQTMHQLQCWIKYPSCQGSEVKWSEWKGTTVRSCGCFDAHHHIIIGSYSKGLFNAVIQIRISWVLQSEMPLEASEKGNWTRSEPSAKL